MEDNSTKSEQLPQLADEDIEALIVAALHVRGEAETILENLPDLTAEEQAYLDKRVPEILARLRQKG